MVRDAINDDVERLSELRVNLLPTGFPGGRGSTVSTTLLVCLSSGGSSVSTWMGTGRRPTLVERGAAASWTMIAWRRGTSLAVSLVLSRAGTISGEVPR
jgi:hypothetical protein